jgi:hypothetical protein
MAVVVGGWPRMMDPDMALAYVGGEKIFNSLCKMKEKPLKPRVQGRGCTRYDRDEMDAALDRWPGFDEGET